MTLQVREQHIRRNKATSNICTAQALLANMTAMYGIWHRAEGLTVIAKRIRFRAEILRDEFNQMGIKVINHLNNYFDTLTLDCLASGFSSADYVLSEFHKHDINLRKISDNLVSLSINETTTIDDLASLIEIFAYMKDEIQEIGEYLQPDRFEDIVYRGIPADLERKTSFMQQEIFNSIYSETELMRYCTRLADKDYGLANGIMPLGSCTMKLNSAVVMMPITFPGFCNIHPFAPKDQTFGYNYMIKELEIMLSTITHYAKVSLQPNSGANGEFAGLTAIMKYHASRNDNKRKLCLIPTSAHGTNPATAVICGLTVVPVNCMPSGDIDMEDFD